MTCEKKIVTSLCKTAAAFVDCVKNIYDNEEYDIYITLFDKNGEKLDLDELSFIEILLYDIREYPIARFVYPFSVHSYYTYEYFSTATYIVDDNFDFYPEKEIWFDNNELFIKQIKYDLNSLHDDEYIDNKGIIYFSLTRKITDYLMNGYINVDLRLVFNNDDVVIIKCLTIAKKLKNRFNL